MDDKVVAATDFERRLHEKIAATYASGSGTVWGPSAEVLAAEIGLPADDVGLISVTEDNVINNRPLSAGLITKPRRFLVLVVGPDVGLQREEDAIVALIPKTRHLTTVGLAGLAGAGDGTSDTIWRIQRLIEVKGIGIADQVISHFPLVSHVRREELIPIGSPENRGPWAFSAALSAGATAHITIPSSFMGGGLVSPGDSALLCDPSLNSAHSAGVVKVVQTASNDVTVTIERIVSFPAPISMEPAP